MLQSCEDQIYRIKMRGMGSGTRVELQGRRFLLSTRDPIVVLPKTWAGSKAPWAPRTGDYVAVVFGGKIFPAIVGDYGPGDKIGEASLKLARALNPKADGKTRAVSELSVTYLFFPGTADKFGEPDLKRWNRRCQELLGEMGGLGEGFSVSAWE